MEDEFLEPTRHQSGREADGMTDEEINRFASVLKECERIRAKRSCLREIESDSKERAS